MLGLTLKPIRIALDAFASVISVSVITPMLDNIIFGTTSSCLIFSIAFFNASLEPCTSDLIIIDNSFGAELFSKADSLLAEIIGVFSDLLCSIL